MVDLENETTGPSPLDEPRDNVVTSQRFALLQRELVLRTRMQTAVAELGQASLTLIDAELLTGQACALVVDTLGVETCRTLEYLPDEEQLVTSAVVGANTFSRWGKRLDEEALRAFDSEEPLVFSEGSPHGAPGGGVTGVSVRLRGRYEPFGVLAAYSTDLRTFREFEVEFLQSIANVLAAAIERKRTSRELDEMKAEVARRERLGGVGSWTWSRGERDWKWSEEVYRLLDMDTDEEASDYSSLLAHIHADDRATFAAMIERAFSVEGEQVLEHRVIRGDGRSRFVRTIVQGVFGGSGKALRLIGTIQDITDVTTGVLEKARLNAMIELAAQEWRTTCDSLEAMLLVLDRNGVMLRLNERARQLVGVPFKEAIGSTLPDRKKGEPWSTVRELVTVVAETQMASTAVAIDALSGKQWQISARSLRSEELGDERVVMVIQDVSDEIRKEQVRRDGDVLESVMHLIASLNQRARRPMDALTTLLSQEIGSTQLTAAQLKTARASTYDLGRLFRNLSEYAQPFAMSFEAADVESLLDDAVGAVAPVAIARGIAISGELEHVRTILGHSSRLNQLFTSFLRLFIERSEARDAIEVKLEETERQGRGCVVVSIHSPRAIFSNQELRWALDPRLPRIDDDDAARLSVSHRIVEEHGGDMLLANLREQPGALATFSFPVFAPLLK